MIQRIQSVFLFLSALAAVLLFFFPLASYYGEFNTVDFYVYFVKNHVPSGEALFGPYFLLPTTIITVLLVVIPFGTIFLFKKMQRQLKLIQFALLLDLLLVGLILLYYADAFAQSTNAEADYQFGIFLPLIHIVFSLLAMRSIKKDFSLIRSADRLR